MDRIEKITHIAENTLLETKLELKEQGEESLKRDIDRLLKKANSGNVKSLISTPNIEIFKIFVKVLNEDVTYEEVEHDISDVITAVNSWTYAKDGDDLKALFDNTNYGGYLSDNKYLANFSNLRLTPIFMNYPMKFVYKAMLAFLRLKHTINEQNIKNTQETDINSLLVMSKPTFQKRIKTRLKTPSEIYDGSEFHGFIKVLEEHVTKRLKEKDIRKGQLQKRKEAFEELLAAMKKEEFKEITSIPGKWHQYLDPPTLEEIYYLIQDNLFKEKNKLKEEEQTLNSVINRSKLTTYLYSHQINPSIFSEDTLSSLERIPDITTRIEVLRLIGFNIIDIIEQYNELLIYLTEDKSKKLYFLINSHAISSSTLRANIYHILDDKYSELMTNYEILKPIIDFDNIFYNDSVMFINPRELKNRLGILAEYKLTKNNYIFLLCNYNYLSIYDLLIEQEIPEYLFISICKTDNPLNTIKRIMIYKLIGESYETPNHNLKKEVTSANKFACPDYNLDEYIINCIPSIIPEPLKGTRITSVKNNSLVKEIDEKYRLEDIYIIGGINISRDKFLRNFEAKDCKREYLLQSLISNSILDESSLYRISSELEEKQLKK